MDYKLDPPHDEELEKLYERYYDMEEDRLASLFFQYCDNAAKEAVRDEMVENLVNWELFNEDDA